MEATVTGFRYSTEKHPYYKVQCNQKTLRSGKKIKGWWIYDGPDGAFTTPNPAAMNSLGWCQVILCIFLCYPCACLPCFFSTNYDGYQIPVFEDTAYVRPTSNEIPVAVPVVEESFPRA